MTEVEQAPQNGIDLTAANAAEDDDSSKARPADIEQDMREMERRKRVEAIMGSKLFREELERIVDAAREGGSSAGILQQLSDIVGVPSSRVGSIFKTSNCMLPINDIRGVESMGYAKGEKILRCKLAATFRLLDLYGWTQGLGAQITARLKVDQEYFLVNPYGLLYHEITASSLNKVDMQGQIVEQGTTNFGVNRSHFILHSVVHAARPDIRCAIYIGCSPVVAVSSLKTGLLPLTKDACVLGEISTHPYSGSLLDAEERDKLVRNLGPNSKVMLLSNHGALCCGETIEEAFYAACHIVQACETQLKLLPVGIDNLSLIAEESRKMIYEQSRRPPEDLEKKFAAAVASVEAREAAAAAAAGGEEKETTTTTTAAVKVSGASPKWRVGGAEFEALMRMLDNAGYRTGYIYRHPLVKSDPPKPKNDVELPPAVSSLGYLLEEEELFRQGIWKKGDIRKGGDRSRWLNSPNVYQKVEVLETGTPDPKKITKWVAEGSPTHSTPVRIEDPLQFVPAGTNPKEFKRLQQQIKDNRRADKISAGPQSHILEGVTWDEANRIKDATVSSAGDHVVLMGAASKGIIQRGFQHNATVYKAPYAKNPFDNVTDDELNEYKRTVERKKKSIHGEYTDTDFSESEALSSLQTSGAQQTKQTTTTTTAAVSQSEPEDVSEHQVMRIETQQAPVPSQPEVVLSDATLNFINGERSHTATYQKPPTGRDKEEFISLQNEKIQDPTSQVVINDNNDAQSQASQGQNKENIYCGSQNIKRNTELIAELKNDLLFQRQKHKLVPPPPPPSPLSRKNFCNDDDVSDNDGSGGSSNTHFLKPPLPLATVALIDESAGPSKINSQLSAPTFVVLPSFEQTFAPILPRNIDCCNFYLEPYATGPPHYYEPLYESINSTASDYMNINVGATVEPLSGDENIYKKSLFCYTPTICDTIFEALQKPPHDNDLIFNIPFSTTSPAHSTTGSGSTTPRKCRADSPYKQAKSNISGAISPYRTVSHFGFNSPQRAVQPQHKHIPCSSTVAFEPKKYYIPIQKSISYEEIFSSPRYVDLCENCFEKIVRLKPELIQMQTRLRNIADFNQQQTRVCGAPESVLVSYQNTATDSSSYSGAGNYDYVECATETTETTLPMFSSQLEPVPEVEEASGGSSEDHFQHHHHHQNMPKYKTSESNSSPPQSSAIDKSTSNSTFIEKITRMNYSEESMNSNFLHTPHTVSSDITIEVNDEDIGEINNNDTLAETSKRSASDDKLSNSMAALDINRSDGRNSANNTELFENDNADLIELHASVTEIWEFGNWLEQPQPQEISLNQTRSLTENECTTLVLLNVASTASALTGSTGSSTRIDGTGTSTGIGSSTFLTRNNSGSSSLAAVVNAGSDNGISGGDSPSASRHTDDSARQQTNSGEERRRRSLMSREERSRRKLEFQELWEDHITFFDGKDQGTLSDTESAIDETTGRQQREQNVHQGKTSDEDLEEQEVFHGRSLIVKSLVITDKNQIEPQSAKADLKVALNVEDEDDDAATSSDGCNSAQTYSVYQSQDNLFFRGAAEAFDAVTYCAVSRVDNETVALVDINEAQEEKPKCSNENDNSEQEPPAYKATVEEFELYTQQSTNKNIESDAKDPMYQLELAYEEVVEANAGAEDTRSLSENFEEILVAVQNLQLTEENSNKQNKKLEKSAEMAAPEGCFGLMPAKFNDDNIGNEKDSESQEFNALERKILKKIEINQLNKTEEIFDKIETTIRNKLTPSKLEQLLQKQKQHLPATSSASYASFSTPEASSSQHSLQLDKIFEEAEEISGSTLRQHSLTQNTGDVVSSSSLSLQHQDKDKQHLYVRRSRSLTPRNDLYRRRCLVSPPMPYKLNRTSTPPRAPRKEDSCQQRTAHATHSTHELFRSTTPAASKRNFVLENIRSAAIPRNNVAVKRLQGNAQAIFGQNPFGGVAPTNPSSTTSVASIVSNNACLDTAAVYAFQSKLVRGSPRFWVSLAQTPTTIAKKSGAVTQKSLQKRRRKLHHQKKPESRSTSSKTCDSTCTLNDEDDECLEVEKETEESIEANELVESQSLTAESSISGADLVPTQVDAEIAALGEQIDQIHPRLENYKRKLDDYGETVAKCARSMDECVVVQQDIAAEQRVLREDILLHQYVEDIACQVQTFSISETED